MTNKTKYRFTIELMNIEPSIYRIIEVPAGYSFWDLHIAIQDAMGWDGYHLHFFKVTLPRMTIPSVIGIPDDDYEDDTLPGWEVPLYKYFSGHGDDAIYEYDFGDSWVHKIILTDILPQNDIKYPICLDGMRACPPEDCGGIPGYTNLIAILKNKDHDEYDSMIDWLGRSYDPEYFNKSDIIFSDPATRYKEVFSL